MNSSDRVFKGRWR